jgi:hypothetical protein
VIFLRGYSPQRNATQLDATNYFSGINATSLGPKLWSDNLTGPSGWVLIADASAANQTKGYLSFNHNSLNFTVFFAASSQEQAVSVYRRPISVSLGADPFAVATVSVSKDIHYGIRFSGVELGSVPFEAWHESSPLQHRPGQGVNENLTANLSLEAYLANGDFPPANSTITSIKFYIEATPGQSGRFSMILSSVAVFPIQQERYSDNASDYNGIILYLTPGFATIEPSNQSVFRAYAGFRIDGTQGLLYRLYLNRGLLQEAEGYIYHQKTITNYEESVLLPTLVNDFPAIYSDSNLTYISVVALQGSIIHFHIDTLIFQYLSQLPTDVGILDDQNFATFLYTYYVIFLFVTPVVMTLLFARLFKNEKDSPSHS